MTQRTGTRVSELDERSPSHHQVGGSSAITSRFNICECPPRCRAERQDRRIEKLFGHLPPGGLQFIYSIHLSIDTRPLGGTRPFGMSQGPPAHMGRYNRGPFETVKARSAGRDPGPTDLLLAALDLQLQRLLQVLLHALLRLDLLL